MDAMSKNTDSILTQMATITESREEFEESTTDQMENLMTTLTNMQMGQTYLEEKITGTSLSPTCKKANTNPTTHI